MKISSKYDMYYDSDLHYIIVSQKYKSEQLEDFRIFLANKRGITPFIPARFKS